MDTVCRGGKHRFITGTFGYECFWKDTRQNVMDCKLLPTLSKRFSFEFGGYNDRMMILH